MPQARVVRGGVLSVVPADRLVPGDVIRLEAGDLVPADGRLLSSASVEVAESGLTGESAPVAKAADDSLAADAALGDRTTMVFQSTSLTRGSASAVVTETGAATEMGRIAGLLRTVERLPSPLESELRELTVRLAVVCLLAVAFIVIVGLARGLAPQSVALIAIATAISSIPSGLPTFLTAMLSYGAQRLAAAKAIVRGLSDVETIGAVSAVNTDKTGTLTLDEMTATALHSDGQWFTVDGAGYALTGTIRHAAGRSLPDFTALGYGLTLCSDAVVGVDETVVGDPTEAALVVLAAKMGVDADTSRREYPRVALVPFDSAYKFMATYHVVRLADDEPESLVCLVKGAPDVVLDRCSHVLWDGVEVPAHTVRDRVEEANRELAGRGLRVMSFAYRRLDPAGTAQVQRDPMAAVSDLVFVALVGIIDPLRPGAKDAVRTALAAGIDVRMITGDHAVTAEAIAADLGLGPGVMTGPQLATLDDAALTSRLDGLHVFGRVSPSDKLRLVSVLQGRGQVVAMTGDAVNDAAALKKADVGVAMGSGSEVSKQAAKIVLTDDNFATLVHAIELGRDVYEKLARQIRFVMVGLFGVVLLMLLASAFDVNHGNALTAVQLLYVTCFIGLFPALALSMDAPDADLMRRPPRDPYARILNRRTGPRWVLYGLVQALAGLLVYWLVPDGDPGGITAQQSMVFAVLGLSTVLLALALRRDRVPAWRGPLRTYLLWLAVPVVATWLAVETDAMQRLLGTTSLADGQWWLVLGLALLPALVIEVDKAFARR